MTTPGKSRQSGIPGPGRISSIPTPGRSRSSSSVYQNTTDSFDDISRAFADAIKANDPAQHRFIPQPHAASASSLSPQFAPQTTQSGHRSVGRPSSAASTSSAIGVSTRTTERAKTPTSARPPSRPPSRHSEAFVRSVSRSFEIGDNVRIESLGFEGLLKYVGEIEGKPGLWAGVELGGGFAGKGKNNGTVNGKKYFSCPQNCGVFVATTKLSPPTVGPSTVQRPSSVASSRGRITPALSGRVTPSFPSATRTPSASSANRATPSASGRLTPSNTNGRGTSVTTPAAIARSRNAFKPVTSKGIDVSLTDKITAGSRASKYMSMTAQQLSSRDSQIMESPTGRNRESPSPALLPPSSSSSSFPPSSPSRGSRMLSSPTRSLGSPLSTPKPSLGGRTSTAGNTGLSSLPSRNRPSVSTPRARVPSAVAMPPPASPISASSYSDHAHSLDSEPSSATCSDYPEAQGKALQDDIPLVITKNTSFNLSSRPESSASLRSTTLDEQSLIEQLQSRIDALEYENERLRLASGNEFASVLPEQLESLERERDEAIAKISYLEEKQAASNSNLEAHAHRISLLEQDLKRITSERDSQQLKDQSCIANLQKKAEEDVLVIQELQASLTARSNLVYQQNENLEVKETEIALLNLKLESMFKELEEEKRELGAQIDELRIAGQETIALYEERLSSADTQRYELELRITSLEAAHSAGREPPPTASHSASSATQIDNETLRDQVHHLQRKISTMEDVIEDARAASEKEEAAFRERMRRLKEKEDAMKKELSEGRKEVERVATSELTARNRVEEIEEALRESTVALENARAEVEALRAEIANVDSLVGDISEGDLSSRVAELTHRASIDRARSEQEISRLTDMLQELRPGVNQRDVDLESQVSTLQQQKATLEAKVLDMTRALDDSTNELETTRKKVNRDVFVTDDIHDGLKSSSSLPSKFDSAVAKEEVTGLKHIIQELQKESIMAAQRIKLLESENQLFSCEAEQLRQEVQLLEDSLHNSSSLEDRNLVKSTTSPDSQDVDSVEQRLKEQSLGHDAEIEQLKKRLSESEIKHARMIHDLNKEISELETLVEAKIYREDELEQEVERLKDKAARAKKSSKNSTETNGMRHRLSSASSNTMSSGGTGQDVCEICERPGHDIFNCDLLKGDGSSKKTMPATTWPPRTVVDLFCEDCESHGHVAADCPHSLDVF